MQTMPHASSTARSERGSALIGVLLLLMMMSALAAALGVSGRTETLVARNHASAAQARTAAEAGLNHAVQVVVDHIRSIDPGAVEPGLDALLADLSVLDIDLGTPIDLNAASDSTAEYEVAVMDEDDPARGADATILNGDGDATNDEDNVATTDNNLKLIVRAIGRAKDSTTVTLEAVIGPYDLGALVTNGDLDISGSVDIDGTNGDVHSNGDMVISGGSASISGTISTSGEYTGSLAAIEGAPEVPLPTVDPEDYLQHADFILTSDGTMTDGAGTVLCTWSAETSCNSWEWSAGSQTWTMNSNSAVDGTYYVEGNATISGSPGSFSGKTPDPWNVTLIAEKSIDISGSPDIAPETNQLLFVAGGDLEISGGLDSTDPLSAQGQILVHEQINFSGSPSLFGQIVVENAEDVETLVHTNEISGSVAITYNGGLGSNLYTVTGWREVR
ncbi:MAG: hypothetical protein A3F70_15655 [Acidobacteria bacterium RIFCSPLOWO2_12_FULL_67_14]|nr:MAG: hypothetical protein A3F70_15655 [Acidobacteria bacterium RIFCSPLOWO2_12_FULL_67_14]